MESKAYPDGVSDFKALVTGNYHFVDKTLMIRDLCGVKNQTMLFTRPRRFGKSMNLSMLDYFFNIRYAGEPNIFEDLKISSCESCKSYRNAYPVIKLNFGDFSCYSGEELLDCIRSMNDSLANDILGYVDSDKLSERDTRFLERCSDPSLNRIDTIKAVRKMCGLLRSVYGKKVLILVDEYDYCIQNIHSREAYDSVISELRPFMEQTFKFNEDCEFAVVTGIMPLAKTSMLSSFNNANVCSILDSRGEEYFGFTEAEVSELLESTGNGSGCLSEIRRWYDGYRFGDADVYNPYSVMMYLSKGCRTEAYWNNMTGGGLSEDILSNMGAEPLIELKGLREKTGSEILSPISTRIAYADIITPAAEPYAVYSYLAMAGYLNAVKTGEVEKGIPVCRVSMVNEEVSIAFDSLVKRATEVESGAEMAIGSIYRRNPSMLKKYLESMLSGLAMDRNWSQDENPTARHNRYRDIIMAFLVTPELIAKEEMPKGYGYTDILFERTRDHPPVVLEIKTTIDRSCDLRALADEAVGQIDTRCYAGEPGMEDAILVGIAIRMKTVEIRFG